MKGEEKDEITVRGRGGGGRDAGYRGRPSWARAHPTPTLRSVASSDKALPLLEPQRSQPYSGLMIFYFRMVLGLT